MEGGMRRLNIDEFIVVGNVPEKRGAQNGTCACETGREAEFESIDSPTMGCGLSMARAREARVKKTCASVAPVASKGSSAVIGEMATAPSVTFAKLTKNRRRVVCVRVRVTRWGR